MTTERTVTLNPLPPKEWEAWRARAIRLHAEQQSAAEGRPLDACLLESEAELPQLLPDGLQTAGMSILAVATESGERVGSIWVGPAPGDPTRGYVYDIEISDERQGQGFGRAAMLAIERRMQSEGFKAIGLYVFDFNDKARNLYLSLGYGLVKAQDHGQELQKPLVADRGGDSG